MQGLLPHDLAFPKEWLTPSSLLLGGCAAVLLALLSSAFYNLYLSPLRNIPTPSRWVATTILWHRYHMIKRDKYKFVHDAFMKHGPVVRAAPNIVFIGDYKFLKDIYMTKLDKAAPYVGFETNHGTPNSFSAIKAAEAQGKRRGMLPHYATANLIPWQETMHTHIAELLKVIEHHNSNVDVLSLIGHALVDILSEVVLGDDVGAVTDWSNGRPNPVFAAIGLWPKQGIAKGQLGSMIWGVLSRLPGKDWQELVESDNNLANFVGPRVRQAIARPDDERPCLASRLAGSKDLYTGRLWDVEHIISECVDHFLAGTETTSHTMSYIMWTMAVRPDIMKKLQAELDANMEVEGQQMDIQEAARLPYLNGVIKETLRLFAAVPNTLNRILPEPGLHVHGHFLPAGTEVGLQAYTTHRDPEAWGPDPLAFRPERWAEPTEAMLAAYIPFSIGGRNCPGMNLAYTDLRLLVSAVCRNFDVEPTIPTGPGPMDGSVVSPPSTEVRVNFLPRRRE